MNIGQDHPRSPWASWPDAIVIRITDPDDYNHCRFVRFGHLPHAVTLDRFASFIALVAAHALDHGIDPTTAIWTTS